MCIRDRYWGHDLGLWGSRDVIDHVIIWLGICGFLLMVHWNHASILHRYGDMGPQRYWGHDLDLLGSRDVIDHVTIGLGVSTFLLMVNDDHAPILHLYGDTGLQIDLLTSSVTWPFDSAYVVSYWWSIGTICVYLAPLQRYKASNLHLPMLKAKSSLRMPRVTWPVGRMTTYQLPKKTDDGYECKKCPNAHVDFHRN